MKNCSLIFLAVLATAAARAESIVYVNADGSCTAPYDTPDVAATNLDIAVAYANAQGIRKVKVIGQIEQSTKLTLENVEIFGDGWDQATLHYTKEMAHVYTIGENVLMHGLKLSGSGVRGEGMFLLQGESSVISNCWVTSTYHVTAYVGKEIAGHASAGLITHCLFSDNHTNNGGSEGKGSDMYGCGILGLSGTARMVNSVFTGNKHYANVRGPMDGTLSISGSAVLENCVIYGNTVKAVYNPSAGTGNGGDTEEYHRPRRGAGVFVVSGSPTVRNCIIRNNLMPKPYMEDPGDIDIYTPTEQGNIYIRAGATPVIENCNVPEGQIPECATGCQTADPKFADPDNATCHSRDFSIADDSPCVDAGLASRWHVGTTDYTGLVPRYQGSGVDIGAYEVASDATVPAVHIEMGGETAAEKYATATMDAFAVGIDLDDDAVFKWYTSDPSVGSPEPFAEGNPVQHRFTNGVWSIYLKIENADGAGQDLYGYAPNAVTVSRGADYYVSETGSDENSGDIDAPFKTLTNALAVVKPGQRIKIVGMLTSQDPKCTITNVTVYGDGPSVSGFASTKEQPGLQLTVGAGGLVHGLKIQKARIAGGIVRTVHDTAVVSNCWITSAWFSTGGNPGGLFSAGTVTHCLFYGNNNQNSGVNSGGDGGVVRLSGTAAMRNCVLTSNIIKTNSQGPLNGIVWVSDNASMENCVVYGNSSTATQGGDEKGHTARNGSGIYVSSGSPTVRNCIIRNNLMPKPYMEDPGDVDIYSATEQGNIYIAAAATPVIENCNTTEGQIPEYATGCQTGDPKFVNPDNATVLSRDFSIAADSPCVDAGLASRWHIGATDYTGLVPRYQGGGVDIGAYEVASDATVPAAHIEIGGEVSAEKYATATMDAFVVGIDLDDNAVFKWYASDPSVGSPEPFATGNPVQHRFTAGVWSVYLKIENADGAGQDLYGCAPNAVTVSRGADYYVSAKGSDENSGDIDAPFATVYHAVSVCDPSRKTRIKLTGTAEIQEKVSEEIVLENIELYGESRTTTIWKGLQTGQDPKVVMKDNSLMYNVKLDTWRALGAITMLSDTAVVSNVWVRNAYYSTGGHPGLNAEKGLVTHSLFSHSHNNYGPVFELSGTCEIRNCIFTRNWISDVHDDEANGLIHVSGSAKLENNVIYDNYALERSTGEQLCAGVVITGGKPLVRNNIVRYNRINGTSSTGGEVCNYVIKAGADGSRVRNNNSEEGFGSHAQTADPKFTDPDNGTLLSRDFTVAADSPCVDAGSGRGWRRDATDHAGNPRIQGAGVDIGAYEYNSGVIHRGIIINVR